MAGTGMWRTPFGAFFAFVARVERALVDYLRTRTAAVLSVVFILLLLVFPPGQLEHHIEFFIVGQVDKLVLLALGLMALSIFNAVALAGRAPVVLVADLPVIAAPSLLAIIPISDIVLVVAALVTLAGCWLVLRLPQQSALLRWGYWVGVVLAFIILIAGALATIHIPVLFPRGFGAVVLILYWFLAIRIIVAAATRVFSPAKYIFAAVGIAFILGSTIDPVETTPFKNKWVTQPPGAPFQEWLTSRADLDFYRQRDLPYPVFIGSANGGGIYAAAYSYQFFKRLQTACPRFSQHFFALSAVSGGAVGAGIYNAEFFTVLPRKDDPCDSDDTAFATHPEQGPIADDFLSPVVAALLFVDVPQRFWPYPFDDRNHNRARALELAMAFRYADTGVPYFGRHQQESWVPFDRVPALFLNATDLARGERYLFAPFPIDSAMARSPDDSIDLVIARAVAISASFPWVSPTPELTVASGRKILGDGGYFDNTGGATGSDIYEWLRRNFPNQLQRQISIEPAQDKAQTGPQLQGCAPAQMRPYVMSWRHIPGGWDNCSIPIFLSYVALQVAGGDPLEEALPVLPTPLDAIMNVRRTNDRLAIARVKQTVCLRLSCEDGADNDGYLVFSLDTKHLDLPLGWQISPETVAAIDSNFGSATGDCATQPIGDFADQLRQRNGCELQEIIALMRAEGALAK